MYHRPTESGFILAVRTKPLSVELAIIAYQWPMTETVLCYDPQNTPQILKR